MITTLLTEIRALRPDLTSDSDVVAAAEAAVAETLASPAELPRAFAHLASLRAGPERAAWHLLWLLQGADRIEAEELAA